MDTLSISSFLRDEQYFAGAPRAGTSGNGRIDKTGTCYHVMTRSWSKENVFYIDVASYRHNLMCNLCAKMGIVIFFSCTNPNHAHEVFLTPDWNTLSEMIRILNTNVSKYIHKIYRNKVRNGKRLFEDTAYCAVKDIVYLFFLGKYIHDNPLYLKEAGRKIPHTCFWMFESERLKEPYRENAYTNLFGMTYTELYEIYKSHTKKEVMEYAKNRFRNWTEEMNRRIFSNS